MIRILIIGTGNLGKRHLQALSNLKQEFEVLCYDEMEVARNSVTSFCSDNKLIFKNIKILDTYSEAISSITTETIVVVVTTAKGRKQLLEDIILSLPKAVIAEKPICQTHEEYLAVMNLSNKNNVPVYVNYIAHLQDFYKTIREEVKEVKNFVFYSNMPQWGMACVGIHHFELLTWLLNVTQYTIVNEGDHSSVYDQKRKGFQDIAGAIVLRVDNNNLCVINNSEFDGLSSIQIITDHKIYTIYELQKVMTVVDKANSGNVEVIRLDYKYVSQYTHFLVESILNDKMVEDSILPDINASYLSHKMLFDYLELMNAKNINIT